MNLKQIKPKDLLRALLKDGFTIKRKSGSYVFLEQLEGNETKRTTISLHNQPIPKGTFKAILKQTGITEEKLRKLLSVILT
jgi:predicted RNA binding protein YcfA (HicA-like mRNA interferase family)